MVFKVLSAHSHIYRYWISRERKNTPQVTLRGVVERCARGGAAVVYLTLTAQPVRALS